MEFSDVTWKVILILATCGISTVNQLNLRSMAPALPTSLTAAYELGIIAIGYMLIRAVSVAGFSLMLNWYSYKKFGYLELLVAQAMIYVFAFLANLIVLEHPFHLGQLLAVLLIISGVVVFYATA